MGKVKQRGKKRKFNGNQFSKKKRALESEEPTTEAPRLPQPTTPMITIPDPTIGVAFSSGITASSSKVKDIDSQLQDGDTPSGNRIFDITILSSIFSTCLCPECLETGLHLQEDLTKMQGFSTYLSVVCQCGYSRPFYSSKISSKSKRFNVNTRSVYAFRCIGIGHAGLKKFAGLMNIPTTFSKTTYQNISMILRDATKAVANKSMLAAAKEINNSDDIINTGVSMDGAWQRRGYASHNGVVTAISIKSGKVLDTEPMSKYCRICQTNGNFKTLERKKAPHVCKANYTGSAPSMEPEGAKRMFGRSIQKHRLRYSDYYGDGDSKSHIAVENIYDGIKVMKKECIGHVQKRVGNRLRKLKLKVKGLGGRNKLTNATIDRLQNYYGIAIRSNVGDLEGMKKSILASLFHVASSETNVWHDHCPTTPDTWCLYNRDKINSTKTYKPGVGLPKKIVLEYLKPIYAELSSDVLLKKCLHGMTQNANESFNALIWERVPKSNYVGYTQLEIGVYDAVAVFNDGRSATLDILQAMGLQPGVHCVKACKYINNQRIKNSVMKSSGKCKVRRKIIRGGVNKIKDKNIEKEGKTYEAGGFS